jgi:hypothetical protein
VSWCFSEKEPTVAERLARPFSGALLRLEGNTNLGGMMEMRVSPISTLLAAATWQICFCRACTTQSAVWHRRKV